MVFLPPQVVLVIRTQREGDHVSSRIAWGDFPIVLFNLHTQAKNLMVFTSRRGWGIGISCGKLEEWPEGHDSAVCMLSLSMLGIRLLPHMRTV